MTDREAIYKALCETGDSLEPWMVYADYLEAHADVPGDEFRVEYCRLYIEQRQLWPDGEPVCPTLEWSDSFTYCFDPECPWAKYHEYQDRLNSLAAKFRAASFPERALW